MQSFYSSLLGIPVAGATLPVLAFLLLAIYGKNPVLGAAVLILGIGHIGIHWMHKKEIGKNPLERSARAAFVVVFSFRMPRRGSGGWWRGCGTRCSSG